MKIVPLSCLNTISGGQAKQLFVTQKESLDGISAPCLQFIKDSAEASQYIKNKEDGQIFDFMCGLKAISICSLNDIMSADDNLPFLTVEYK